MKDCRTCKYWRHSITVKPCSSCWSFKHYEPEVPKLALRERVTSLENQLDVLQSDFNSLLSTLREV